MDELREKIANIIDGDEVKNSDERRRGWGLAVVILDLIRNHKTKLELVTECTLCEFDGMIQGLKTDKPVMCPQCGGTKEIARPMTRAEVLEFAEDLFSDEGQFVMSLKGRVRVRK